MKKVNYYARTLGYGSSVHAFASRSERDAWVERDWANRMAIDAREASGTTKSFGRRLILHGSATVPSSWAGAKWAWRIAWQYAGNWECTGKTMVSADLVPVGD